MSTQSLRIDNFDNPWEEMEWKNFRNSLSEVLTFNTCTVTFIKKNGDERVMTCTLQPELLPTKVIVEGEEKKPKVLKDPLNSLPVYDINAKGWRSFIVKNIKAVTFEVKELSRRERVLLDPLEASTRSDTNNEKRGDK